MNESYILCETENYIGISTQSIILHEVQGSTSSGTWGSMLFSVESQVP